MRGIFVTGMDTSCDKTEIALALMEAPCAGAAQGYSA